MDSNLFKNDIPILYHSPGISSRESEMHYHIFSQHSGEVIPIEDSRIAFDALKVCTNKFFVITSEINGEQFLEKIDKLPSVLAIIILCKDANYHKKWITRFQKVHAVIDSGPQEVIDEIMKIHSNIIAGGMIKLAQNGSVIGNRLEMTKAQASIEKADYFHFRQDVEMEFRTVLLIYLKSLHASTPLADKVLEELKNLKPQYSKKIEQIYNKRENNLLEAIIYLYSTDILYEQLNESLASRQYDKIKNITAAILQEIKERPDLQLDSSGKKKFLYRGVGLPEVVSQYLTNKKGFWPAFTSTSLSEETAKIFSGPDGIIFRINLSQENAHPHILLSKKMSEHKEDEVLLLPYFAIKVTDISFDKDLIYIDVEQDQSQQVLSLNDEKFKAYWQSTIQQEIKPRIEEIFKKAEEETKQRLRNINYFPSELIPYAFEFLKEYLKNPSCPYKIAEDILNALKTKTLSSALNDDCNNLTSGYLRVIDQLFSHANKQIKTILEEIFGSFKTQLQSHLGSMLASDYEPGSLPLLRNLNDMLNSENILESLDINQFCFKLETKEDKEWIELIEKQIKSPNFLSLIESLVIQHVVQSFNNLKNKLFEIINKTMEL